MCAPNITVANKPMRCCPASSLNKNLARIRERLAPPSRVFNLAIERCDNALPTLRLSDFDQNFDALAVVSRRWRTWQCSGHMTLRGGTPCPPTAPAAVRWLTVVN